MALKPNDKWMWYFDDASGCLAIALSDDLHFQTRYQRDQLVTDAFSSQAFNTSDAEIYAATTAGVEECFDLSEAMLTQIGLNAAAARRFLRPQLPKSWFFLPSTSTLTLAEGNAVELFSHQQAGYFVVIEAGCETSVLMVLSDRIELNEYKTIKAFDVIKVMNDRVQRYLSIEHGANSVLAG